MGRYWTLGFLSVYGTGKSPTAARKLGIRHDDENDVRYVGKHEKAVTPTATSASKKCK